METPLKQRPGEYVYGDQSGNKQRADIWAEFLASS